MALEQELSERARELVGEWPPGGLVAGLLPDPSDAEWAGRAALALALASADRRGPVLILDLAPEATDLASRFDAAGDEERGIAELVAGEAELWEIVHRHAAGDAFYLPCGVRTPGAALARSPAAASLADRVRSAGRIALVLLDRRGAGEAASAGWVDGFVRLGERGVSSARLSGDARAFGHLERRGGEGGADTAADRPAADTGGPRDPGAGRERGREAEREAGRESRRETGREPVFLRGPDDPGREEARSAGREGRRTPEGGGRRDPEREGRRSPQREKPRRRREARNAGRAGAGARLKLPRRRRTGGGLRKAGRAAAVAALLLAGGVTASTWLGGPGWQDVRDASGTAVGRVGDAVPAGAGGAAPPADATSGARSDPGASPAGDSVAPAAPSPADSAAPADTAVPTDTAERGG